MSITFSCVNSFNNYTVGNDIEFWGISEWAWIKGKISYIRVANDTYFVYVRIDYWYKKPKTVDIYREDWLRISQAKSNRNYSAPAPLELPTTPSL